jgi:hypothetical protein
MPGGQALGHEKRGPGSWEQTEACRNNRSLEKEGIFPIGEPVAYSLFAQ